MPSPVPAGFTRGAIMFIGNASSEQAEESLLQRFWQEAGAYGSRIVVLACGSEQRVAAERLAARFTAWEAASVEAVTIESRPGAQSSELGEKILNATGAILLGDSPMRIVGLIGGTNLAQAARRANAQGKVIAVYGEGASVLCQHMLADDIAPAVVAPLVHRDRIHFAPGLGMINRIVVMCTPETRDQPSPNSLGRLLTAVAWNPFLAGVNLETDTGATLYANGQLEIFGEGNALVVDGSALSHTSLHAASPGEPVTLLGVQMHLLARGCTYGIDDHSAAAPNPGDVEMQSNAIKAAF